MEVAVVIVLVLFYLALIVLMIASFWKIYEKAGQPGWASIVPFYGMGAGSYVMIVDVCKLPPIWFWLTFVPCANIVALFYIVFVVPFKLAEKFGKDAGFGVGLLLLGVVFYPILAFGSAQYRDSRRRYDDEDDDYDDRPRRKSRRDDDDDDEDDRPRKKKRDDNW
jgi:hypothetical protein